MNNENTASLVPRPTNGCIVEGEKYLYADLCRVLGEKKTSGNGRIAQVNRWRLKYNLEYDSQTKEYTVKEIYDVQLTPEELRGRKNEYVRAMGYILFVLCYDNPINPRNSTEREYRKKHPRVDGTDAETSDFYEFTASKSQLYVLLGLCKEAFINHAYNEEREKIEELAEHPNLMRVFQDEVFGQCKQILESARKGMKRQMLLNSHETVEFAYKDKDAWDWRVASVEEENKLITCKREALEAIGAQNEVDVYKNKKESEYRALILQKMKSEYDIEIESYRNSITFWANKETVNRFVGKMMNGKSGDLLVIKKSVINAAMIETNDRFIKWLDQRSEYDWNTINNDYKSSRTESRGRRVSQYEWKKWDDLLMELYQGDELAKDVHNMFTELGDENNEYFNGEIKRQYDALREVMKVKYIRLTG